VIYWRVERASDTGPLSLSLLSSPACHTARGQSALGLDSDEFDDNAFEVKAKPKASAFRGHLGE